MPTYETAPDDAQTMLDDLIQTHRHDLVRAEAEIMLRFAYGEFEGGVLKRPALKVRGKRAAGKCKVHSPDDRASGTRDVTITIDGDLWPRLSEQRRRALVHHELCHIDHWSGDRDNDSRPLLKARQGDWDFDGFHEVLSLYGAESFEASHLNVIAETHRQLDLPFRTADPAAEARTETEAETEAPAPALKPKRTRKAAEESGESIAAQSRS